MRNIDPTALKERLDKGDSLFLLDIRETWEYELCQLENSINIPMSVIAEKVSVLDEKKETLVICHHGMRSMQVGQYLENMGFNDVINLDGGLDAWAKTVDPEMPQY